jgi:ribosomal protein S27E
MPTLTCDNGHYFTKRLKRYADVWCPLCGSKDVTFTHPEENDHLKPASPED